MTSRRTGFRTRSGRRIRPHACQDGKKKVVRDQIMADKSGEKGLVIVHTGAGKGKSSSAFGMIVRCVGHGFPCAVVQFIKGAWDTGERAHAHRHFGDLLPYAMGEGFTWETQDRARDIAAAKRLGKGQGADRRSEPAMVVLDEINIALRYDYLMSTKSSKSCRRRSHRSACRAHRPQRQGGADRDRRSRHRDDAGEASLPLRRQGASRRGVLIDDGRAMMIQGAGSDVGKSLIVAGCARALSRAGLRVLPFKPQNMSNNAAVTVDGGEIGRAQALQALAACVEPHTDMNPVLLKPETDVGAQVIVQGKRIATARAREDAAMKPSLMPCVIESFERLKARRISFWSRAPAARRKSICARRHRQYGVCAQADVPVMLVGDIDRGGVIAQTRRHQDGDRP